MDAIQVVAQLMEVSAITAPKSKGENFVRTRVLKGDALKKLSDAMIEFGEKTKKKDFDRDGQNVARSQAVVLIGIKDAAPLGLNCGACGFPDCNTLNQQKKTVVYSRNG